MKNPGFNSIEFDGFRKQAGLSSYISITGKTGRDAVQLLDEIWRLSASAGGAFLEKQQLSAIRGFQ